MAWQYSHPPLTTQLDGGVRSFELDAYWDPQGGLYGQVRTWGSLDGDLRVQRAAASRRVRTAGQWKVDGRFVAGSCIPARLQRSNYKPSFKHTRLQAAGMRIAGQNGWLTDAKYKQPGFKVGSGWYRQLCSLGGWPAWLVAAGLCPARLPVQPPACCPRCASPGLQARTELPPLPTAAGPARARLRHQHPLHPAGRLPRRA